MAEKEPLPITTATIARLYQLQGKLERAESLYRQLLAECPEDPRLAEGLAEVIRRKNVETGAADGDRVELRPRGDAFICTWSISEEGLRRARLVLGEDGVLTLRILSFPVDKSRPPKDRPLPGLSGTEVLPSLSQGSILGVAVGLLAGADRFVSIAHNTSASPAKPPR